MTANACPAFHSGSGLVAPVLEQVDCQIASYVEKTYVTLFGPFGQLEPALTVALTLYVAFYGFQLISGRGDVRLAGFGPKILVIGLVLVFATRWGAYQTFFMNLVYGGADQLAALMVGSESQSVLLRLDATLQEITRLADTWNDGAIARPDALTAVPAPDALDPQDQTGAKTSMPASTTNLLWLSAILLALSTMGLLIITKVVLGLLLAIGPLLIATALFSATRGLFEGWLRTLALYALAVVFTMALAGGALVLAEPMVSSITAAHAQGDASPQPVFILAVTVFVVSLLALQLLRLCAHLTGAWRLPARADNAASETGRRDDAQQRETISTGGGRVADMVLAVERTGRAGFDGRNHDLRAAIESRPAHAVPPSLLSRRTGQRYQIFNSNLGIRGRLA